MTRALLLTGWMLLAGIAWALVPSVALAQPARAQAWVYEGEAFKFEFDHDGAGVGSFVVELDGVAVATAGAEALLPRTVTVSFARGLERGTHTLDVHTVDEAGVVLAKSDTLRLEVRERRPDRAATHLRVKRGEQNQER